MRIQSIDSFRVIAILAVISIHTQPFSDTHYFGENDKVLAALFYQGTRFAVPFFFIAAGYFFGKKLENKKNQANNIVYCSILRVLEIWIFWNIFYIVTTSTKNDAEHSGVIGIILGRFNTFFSDSTWEHIIFEGARVSLWFLISLALAYFIVGLFRCAKSKDKCLIILSIILYGIGLLGGAYSHTYVGFNLGFNTRNGPFISTIFVATGYLIASNVQVKFSDLKSACYVLLAGIAMTLLEIGYFYFTNDKSAFNHEFFIGTYFISLGVFLILVAKPQTVGWSWMPTLGRLTLGVYVSHSFFNWSLWPLRYYFDHAIWEIGYPVMVYLSSLLFIWLLSQIKLIRRYVS